MGFPEFFLENDMDILVGGFESSILLIWKFANLKFFFGPLLFSSLRKYHQIHAPNHPTFSPITSLSSDEVRDVRRSLGRRRLFMVRCARSRLKLAEDGLR